MSTAGRSPAFDRILLKLSGEALMGDDAYGINQKVLQRIVGEIKDVVDAGVQVAIVIGAGNIFRGIAGTDQGIDRVTADYMGMLATVMNSMALQDALVRADVDAVVQSAIPMDSVVESYDRRKALRYLNDGKVVIFGGGTGNPFFTTDTAASLRGLEMQADIVLKATKVDGVYTKDPITHADATRYEKLTYDEVLEKRLAVMDAAAIVLCRDHKMPMCVFSINDPGTLLKIILGGKEGTRVES